MFKSKTVTRGTHSPKCIGGKRAIPHVSKQAPTCFCSFIIIIIVLVSFLMFPSVMCSWPIGAQSSDCLSFSAECSCYTCRLRIFCFLYQIVVHQHAVYKCSAGKQWTPPELSNWLCQFVGSCHADLWRTEFSHSSIDGLFHYTFLTTKLHHCSTFSPCVDNDSHRASPESHTSLHHVIWNSSTHKVTSRGRWGADPMLSHLYKYKVASYSCVTAVHGW